MGDPAVTVGAAAQNPGASETGTSIQLEQKAVQMPWPGLSG
jgi:hypothetical protein